jgi:hypothetical protein
MRYERARVSLDRAAYIAISFVAGAGPADTPGSGLPAFGQTEELRGQPTPPLGAPVKTRAGPGQACHDVGPTRRPGR